MISSSQRPEPAAAEGEPSPGARARLRLWAGTLLAATLIRLIRWTSRLTWHGQEIYRELKEGDGQVMLAFWHEQLLLMPYVYPGPRITVMISRHGDGEWIAGTVRRFGIDSTRGSTTRGGATALRGLVRKLRRGYDGAFTPDGPRGPRRKVQPGVILAARLSGLPILPVALGSSRCRRLRSWDRFLVPLPFGRVAYVYGEPIQVPGDTQSDQIEALGERLEKALNEISERAESLARGGRG